MEKHFSCWLSLFHIVWSLVFCSHKFSREGMPLWVKVLIWDNPFQVLVWAGPGMDLFSLQTTPIMGISLLDKNMKALTWPKSHSWSEPETDLWVRAAWLQCLCQCKVLWWFPSPSLGRVLMNSKYFLDNNVTNRTSSEYIKVWLMDALWSQARFLTLRKGFYALEKLKYCGHQ